MKPKISTNELTRRNLLKTAAVVAAAPAFGIEPFKRDSAYFKGLGLTTYSMKRHMKWWWGKPAKGKLDILDFLDYCAELGIEGAEITSYFFQDPLPKSYVNEVKRRAHLLGLDLTGGAMSNNFAYKPGSPENVGHMGYFRKWADHFADMGVPVIRIFAGKTLPSNQSDDQIIENIVANLETACEYAGTRGIILGIENHDFVKNVDYLLRILKAIETDWLGVIWDSANLAPTPDPYKELARIAPYAVTAQVKVMTKVNGKNVHADYATLVEILRKATFRGYLIFEYEEPEDPYTAIPPHLKRLRKLIA